MTTRNNSNNNNNIFSFQCALTGVRSFAVSPLVRTYTLSHQPPPSIRSPTGVVTVEDRRSTGRIRREGAISLLKQTTTVPSRNVVVVCRPEKDREEGGEKSRLHRRHRCGRMPPKRPSIKTIKPYDDVIVVVYRFFLIIFIFLSGGHPSRHTARHGCYTYTVVDRRVIKNRVRGAVRTVETCVIIILKCQVRLLGTLRLRAEIGRGGGGNNRHVNERVYSNRSLS